MAVLKVTYKIRAHHATAFEEIFVREILPLAERHGFHLQGFWRTFVGNAGEYLELWEFDSFAAFEQSWRQFLQDPQLAAIFERTGPMVEDEAFALLETVDPGAGAPPAAGSPLI